MRQKCFQIDLKTYINTPKRESHSTHRRVKNFRIINELKLKSIPILVIRNIQFKHWLRIIVLINTGIHYT